MLYSSTPESIAAHYYYSHQNYQQALNLWKEALKKNRLDVAAVLKISELNLLLENRQVASKALVTFLKSKREKLSPEQRNKLQAKIQFVGTFFLTDTGQQKYLQGLVRIERKDWQESLNLFNQAFNLEGSNLLILKEKARCEKKLKQLSQYYETLKASWLANPFDLDVTGQLLEATVYFNEHANVIESFEGAKQKCYSIACQTAFGISLAEQGRELEAIPVLRSLLPKQAKLSPIVYYALGKAYAARSFSKARARRYLEKFLTILEQNPKDNVWDPYRSRKKIAEVKVLLKKLEEKKPEPSPKSIAS